MIVTPEMSLTDIRMARMTHRTQTGVLTFIIGMQYGSEAKGSIVNYLAPLTTNAVRSGAPNAGHTIYHKGVPHIMRQIPCSWTNPDTKLFIGPGSLISPDILFDEIAMIEKYMPIRDRLTIDPQAHIISHAQIEDEQSLHLAERIGSTSARGREGIGIAMADKILRSERSLLAKNFEPLAPFIGYVGEKLDRALQAQEDVLIEGTQGFSLSINHGDFPYVTSRDVTVASLANDSGLNQAAYRTNVIGVTRSFPIRVAGNSGPFYPDSRELSWEEMREITGNTDLRPEQTSVTNLTRRIATFSFEQYKDACRVNQPDEIALTFADYLDPSATNKEELSQKVLNFTDELESAFPAPVTLINTGPQTTLDFNSYRSRMLRKIS